MPRFLLAQHELIVHELQNLEHIRALLVEVTKADFRRARAP